LINFPAHRLEDPCLRAGNQFNYSYFPIIWLLFRWTELTNGMTEIEAQGETTMKIPTLEEMLEAGVHFGHQVSRWHPNMKPYIFTVRNNVHIIDLQQTQDRLKEACDYVKGVVSKNGTVVFVGTKRQAQDIIEKAAKRCGMPYVTERWLGGTFTNFSSIKKQINKLKDLEKKREAGELKKYTKKEQVDFDKEIERLERFFGGLKSIKNLPNSIFVVDLREDKNSVAEARKKGVNIIGLCDTNANPRLVNYPIPSNDDAVKAIGIIVNAVADAIIEGKK